MRFARCCSVYSSLYRLSSPWSCEESSKESPSAMAFRVFRVARTALGGNSAGDNMVKRGEMTRPAVNGETKAGPPVCLHYSISAWKFQMYGHILFSLTISKTPQDDDGLETSFFFIRPIAYFALRLI